MVIRRKTRVFFLAILLITVVLSAPASLPEKPLLLKITPSSATTLRAVAGAGATVVQELRSCLLVSALPQAVAQLQAAGVATMFIAAPAQGESCFLLHSKLQLPWSTQPDDSHCQLLEENIWLLWTSNPDFRSGLVQPFQLKALELSTIPPGPARTLTFQSRSADGIAQGLSPGESVVKDLVAQVSLERLRADILALQNFNTRYASTPQCEAAGDFILQRFQEMGLSAETDPFFFEGYHESKNIVSVIPGKVEPQQIVLACAHYDSTSSNPFVWAPGADDNASGTAAMLELARILVAEQFDFSIVLLCVSAEEWGLYGSRHYARQARQDGAEIIAVVNLDMIAYPGSQQRVLDVIANSQSEWLAERFIAVAQPYVGVRLDKVVNPSLTWSDHSSFWDQGYAALCGIEDSNNPNYHRASDTLETLDLAFTTEVVQASLAVVAELAQPASAVRAPTGLTAQSQVSSAAFSSFKTVYLRWQANPEPVTGYHVYRAEQSHGPYQCLTSQPITATAFKDPFLDTKKTYFYVLTAVDERGRQSNYSREVRDDANN